MLKRFLFFILLVNCSFCANAQKEFEYVDTSLTPVEENADAPKDPGETVFNTDTSVNIRTVILGQDTVDQWKKGAGYDYSSSLDSLLRDKQKKEQRTDRISPGSSANFLGSLLQSGFLQMILWLIAISVVVYILVQLFLSKRAFSVSSKKQVVQEKMTEDELFLQQNFDELIHQSYKLENYRAATRYLFLKTLKQLSDKNLIRFAIDKTDSKYVREIPTDLQGAFSTLTFIYEHVWYGNFNIGQNQFSDIELKFSSFLKNI